MGKIRRRWRYNDAASLTDVPLTLDEATDVLDNFDKSLLRDESQVEHLMLRVVATCRLVRDLRMNIESEISRRTMHLPAGGASTTLSPEAAARFLSDEQIENLFDRMRREQIDMLRDAQARAESDALVHAAAVSALENLVAELSTDPNVPQDVRERIVRALAEARDAADHRPDSSIGSSAP